MKRITDILEFKADRSRGSERLKFPQKNDAQKLVMMFERANYLYVHGEGTFESIIKTMISSVTPVKGVFSYDSTDPYREWIRFILPGSKDIWFIRTSPVPYGIDNFTCNRYDSYITEISRKRYFDYNEFVKAVERSQDGDI